MITLAEALEDCDFFRGLPKDVSFDLVSSMRQIALEPKDALFQKGDAGDRFYIVLKGVLKVLDTSIDGAEVVLSLMGPGMSFGEIALIDGGTRSASVYALSPACVASLDTTTFKNLLTRHPHLKEHVMKALCRRIRLLSDRVQQLASMDVPARLANVLLGLVQEVGSEMQGRYYLPVRISQTELASMVGASRESVNKFLRAWETSRIIDSVDGRLQIVNPKSLREIAETHSFHS